MAYSQLPALDIQQPFDPLKAVEESDQFSTEQQMLPYARQNMLDQYSMQHTGFGNSMLAQAATQALTADPDDAPAEWDASMQKLADQGITGASQYIGHYRPDLAQRVQSAFEGGGGKTGAANAQGAAQTLNAQQAQALSQMPADQQQQSLKNMNMAIQGFNNVHDQESWNAELDQLRQAGIPVDKFLPSTEYNPINYRNAYQAIQKLTPLRDALQAQATDAAFGVNAPITAPVSPKEATPGAVVYDQLTGKQLFQVPKSSADQWEVVGADKTGGSPIIFNKATGEYRDPATGASSTGPGAVGGYQQIAAKIDQSENATGNPGAQNPNSSATGNGQFVKGTWLATARQAFPQLANVPDDKLLQMRNLPGFSQDMTAALAEQNGNKLAADGHPVTAPTVAMAHKLGIGDAEKVLDSKPETPLSQILSPQVMTANPQLKNLTAGQYSQQIQQQFGNTALGTNGKSPFGNPADVAQDLDPNSGSIMKQTGLSYNAFMWLTGKGSQLPRDKATRTLASQQAEKWANDNGIDISTFGTQYKAQNEVLESNIKRYNQTKTMENEVIGTVQNTSAAANALSLANFTPANWAKLWAGRKVNNPQVQEYAGDLLQLREELAGYYSALSGRQGQGGGGRAITDGDEQRAESVIENGINAQGAKGLLNSVVNSTGKMNQVLENQIDNTNHAVWNLFGVGKNFKPQYPNATNFGGQYTPNPAGAGNVTPANGAPRQLNTQDQAALAWAKSNPNDPRAAKIKQRLGM